MGMDSYLYRTSKEGAKKFEELLKRRSEIGKELKEIENKAQIEHPEIFVHDDKVSIREKFLKVYDKEFVDRFDELYRIYDGDDNDDTERDSEIYYWRKAWGLHTYIVRNCCEDPENDNCVRIYLNKDFVKKLIEELRKANPNVEHGFRYNDNPFGKDDHWDCGDVYRTLGVFEGILNDWDDDTLYYYYSWY